MKISTGKKQIEELLTRGVSEVIDYNHLKKRLLSAEKLRVKFGIDPTSPDIHLGHAVQLLKLRDFQNLGHRIVFIIGDFTGTIGDTSDKETERPPLTEKEVEKNMRTYLKQAGKILEINKTEIHYNSGWLKKLGYNEIGRQADQFSISEFINRENIKKRLAQGRHVSLREVLYPLMQGYDSVMVKADVEIGGTDQKFNLLAGRKLQVYYKQSPQDILMNNLILGADGRKMSKSFGNTINLLDDSNDIFGKIMSLGDDLIINYFEHCTRVPLGEVKKYNTELKGKKANPRDIKMILAFEITKFYWGLQKAKEAKDFFKLVFQEKGIPKDTSTVKLAGKNIVSVLTLTKLAKSKSDARRLMNQGAIKIDGKRVWSSEEIVKHGSMIQKGKRYFLKVI